MVSAKDQSLSTISHPISPFLWENKHLLCILNQLDSKLVDNPEKTQVKTKNSKQN